MHVYFVRHGQTLLNKKHMHQSPGTPLSHAGREEASLLAEELRPLNPTLILTSEYVRARETARIVGFRMELTPQANPLFNEVARPSTLFGRRHFCLETFRYLLLSALKRKDPEWKYADGENFIQASNRARRALAYLEALAGEHGSVIIVSHAVFITILVAHIADNRMPSLWRLLLIFFNIRRLRNTSIIHTEYISSVPRGAAWTYRESAKEPIPA